MRVTDAESAKTANDDVKLQPVAIQDGINENVTKACKKCDLVTEFCSTTTFHGLSHLVNTGTHLYFRAGWALIFTFFVVVSVYSTSWSVINLASYKLTTEISDKHEEPSENGVNLPHIHICDASIFNATRLREMGFNDTMATYLTLATSDNSATYRFLRDPEKQEALEKEFDRILANRSLTMEKVVNYASVKCTDIVQGCTWAGKWIPDRDCCRYFFGREKPYVSIFGGCITSIRRNITQEYESRDAGFILYAVPNAQHVIKFDASLIKAEYILQKGIYFAVSSPSDHIEHVLHKDGRFAWPNSWVSVAITKSIVDNTELRDNFLAPHTCADTRDPVHRNLKTPEYRLYSENNCLSALRQSNYQRFANCTALFLNHGESTNYCRPAQILGINRSTTYSGISRTRPDPKCPKECLEVKYEISPSYTEINKEISVENYDYLHEFKAVQSDPVLLHFYYSTFTSHVRTSHTATLSNFLGEVGGNVGLFLGASLITIVELVALCVRCCTK